MARCGIGSSLSRVWMKKYEAFGAPWSHPTSTAAAGEGRNFTVSATHHMAGSCVPLASNTSDGGGRCGEMWSGAEQDMVPIGSLYICSYMGLLLRRPYQRVGY